MWAPVTACGQKAPTYDRTGDFVWTPDYGREVDKYYNAPTYWM